MDHGADAATIMANATVDITKGAMQISATLLRELLLLAREGSRLKSGETNIDKLIQSLSEGDRIESATIPRAEAETLARLSQKHGVVYAIAELEQDKDHMVLYYRESEAARMKNLLADVLTERVEEPGDPENVNEPEAQKESIELEEVQVPEQADIVEDFRRTPMEQGDVTEVIFEEDDPLSWVELRQYDDGSSNAFVHFEGQESIGPDAADLAANTVRAFNSPVTLRVKGHYTREELQTQISRVAQIRAEKQLQASEHSARGKLIADLLQESAALTGNLHTLVDSANPNNRIIIYKSLKDKGGGELQTVTRQAVFLDGVRTDMDPAQVLQSFGKYRHTEKTGDAARKQFEQIEGARTMNWKREDIADLLPEREHEAGELTDVIFDAANSQTWVELRQYSDESSSCFVHRKGHETVGTSLMSTASAAVKSFEEPVTLHMKGHYSQQKLQAQADKITDVRMAEKQHQADNLAKQRFIVDLQQESATLTGTLHTIADTSNPNNRIAIYKSLEQTGNGRWQTVTRQAVFLDGVRTDMDPAQAFQSYGKYRHTEKTGNAAEKQFEKMMEAKKMNWKREKGLEPAELEEGEPVNLGEGKKPLADYLAGIEQIRKEQSVQTKDLELQLKTPDKAAARGER